MSRRTVRWIATTALTVLAWSLLTVGPAAAQTADEADSWTGVSGFDVGGYDIGYDTGSWNDVTPKLLGPIIQLPHDWTKSLTESAVAVVEWAFEARLASGLSDWVQQLAARFHADLFDGDVSGYDIALLLAAVVAGWAALRGRTTQAAGDIAVTYLVLVAYLGGIALVPGGFARLVDGMGDLANNVSVAVVAVTLGTTAEDLDGCAADGGDGTVNVSCPLRQAYRDTFIATPYDLLNWGRTLGDSSDPDNPTPSCARARDEAVASGPHGGGDEPRNLMRAAGCETEADYQAVPSGDRVIRSWTMAGLATVVLVVTMLIALWLVVVQLLLAGLVVVSPFVALAAAIPGSTRSWLWGWLAGMIRVVAVTVALAMGLALYLATQESVLEITQNEPVLLQSMMMVAVTLALLWARRRLAKGASAAAKATKTKMASSRVGGGNGMMSAAGSAFQPPVYRGLRPNAYLAPQTRRTIRDVRQAPRTVKRGARKTVTRVRAVKAAPGRAARAVRAGGKKMSTTARRLVPVRA